MNYWITGLTFSFIWIGICFCKVSVELGEANKDLELYHAIGIQRAEDRTKSCLDCPGIVLSDLCARATFIKDADHCVIQNTTPIPITE